MGKGLAVQDQGKRACDPSDHRRHRGGDGGLRL